MKQFELEKYKRRLEIENEISNSMKTLRETVQHLSELQAERNMLLDEPEKFEALEKFKKEHAGN